MATDTMNSAIAAVISVFPACRLRTRLYRLALCRVLWILWFLKVSSIS
jgi:hypothetical protein